MPAHIINKKKRTSDISSCIECDFDSLLLSSNVLSGLKKCGFIQPSPIQIQTIPLAKCGVGMNPFFKSLFTLENNLCH